MRRGQCLTGSARSRAARRRYWSGAIRPLGRARGAGPQRRTSGGLRATPGGIDRAVPFGHRDRCGDREETLSFRSKYRQVGGARWRHEFTTAAATRIHSKAVSERLGYSSVSVTLGTYSHTIPSMHREGAGTLDDMVLG